MKHLLVIAPCLSLLLLMTVITLTLSGALTFEGRYGLVTATAWIVVGTSVLMSLGRMIGAVVQGGILWTLIALAGEPFLAQLTFFPEFYLGAQIFATITIGMAVMMAVAFLVAGRDALKAVNYQRQTWPV